MPFKTAQYYCRYLGRDTGTFPVCLPLAGLYIAALYHFKPVESVVHFTPKYWIYILIAGISQILATALMVQLFKQKNYAIGVGLAKVKRFWLPLLE